ncbi:hypothetical protein BD414DRAFT_499539 [Trametes punicea]|nr:hypothetical protein BD414DRAFT_499539 [Trametes punicea]
MSPRPPNAGKPAMVVGNKSGKRTLAEVMQEEMAAKRKKHDEDWAAAAAGGAPAAPVLSGAVPVRTPTTSKFFLAQQRSVSDPRGARAWVHAGGAAASTPTAASRPSSASAISLLASPGAGPSRLSLRGRQSEELHREQEKENLPCDGPNAHADAETGDGEAEADKPMGEPDAVEQEEGYLSPAPSLAQWDSPDISSPVRPRTGRSPAGGDGWDDEFDADVLSSPPLHRQGRRPPSRSGSFTGERVVTRALPLVRLRAPRFGGSAGRRASTSKSISGHREDEREEPGRGPDLRDVFDDWDEVTSGDEDSEWLAEREDGVGSTASSTPGPVTPAEDVGDEDVKMLPSAADEGSSEELEDEDDMRPAETVADCDELEEAAARNASVKVAHGWWAKWARSGTSAGAVAQGEGGGPKAPSSARGSSDRQRAPLRRRETTITPDGRQRPLTASRATAAGFWRGPQSAPQVSKRKSLQEDDLRATGRTRLTFTTEDVGTTPKAGGAKAAGFLRPGSVSGSKEAEGQEEAEDVSRTTVSSRNRHRLEQFRWTPACR